MKTNDINSFVDFIKYSDAFDLIAHQVIFRGQPVRGDLLPSIARNAPSLDTTTQEKRNLEELKLLGASFLAPGETDLDLLVRAQHFGLQTRLLDWTSNSLAALWFACADPSPNDVFVYALDADNLMLGSSIYTDDPFDTKSTRVLRPRLNNPRIIAQHGWFTLHRYSAKDRMFVPLERNRETKHHLHEFRIPKDRRKELLVALDRHGVNARTLFPDLDGLCKYLNWKQNTA